jgi:hypothetical protein
VSRILKVFWNEPVVTLSCATGAAGVLAEQHIIAPWIPLLVLVIVTPLQRVLVTPKGNGGTDAK